MRIIKTKATGFSLKSGRQTEIDDTLPLWKTAFGATP